MQVKIDSIIVKERARKDPGDLKSLMESMERHGQLNPIIVNSKMQLIAGYRRLSAARQLGWDKINATVLETSSKADMLAIEIEENTQRLQFDSKDLEEAVTKLEKISRKNIFQRMWEKIKKFFRKLFRKN
ncbi:MAG: ParB N-terminal domain-containing protein [Spirochaetia bacterium]|nr:ParB N-terminal domain-containing protein [Spirochaetia bacterium]